MMFSLSSVSTSTPGPAIEFRRASKLFGGFVALREVSLVLPAGSAVMLLGPNGAGKSTFLRLVAGLTQPTHGEVLLFGKPPLASRGRVASMGHNTMLYDDLTAEENLGYMLSLQHPELDTHHRRQQVAAALESVALRSSDTRRLGEFSQGMRQRASLARVLLSNPDLLLLDEPFSNLDVASAAAMVERLQRYLAEDSAADLPHTLLLTTHQADLARPLVSQTLVLENGRLVPTEPTTTTPTFHEGSSLAPGGSPV